MAGVILKHDFLRNDLFVVENPKNPFLDGVSDVPIPMDCNICIGVSHSCKTTHLWLEPNGCCIVSEGVLKELQDAGMPQLTVVDRLAVCLAPHPQWRGNVDLADNENRKIYLPTGLETPNGHKGRSGRSSASV